MARLTLRTLLAYIDDTLEPAHARSLGAKVAASEPARDLIERIKRVTRRRGLKSPVPAAGDEDVSDPNTVAEYLSDNLDSDQVRHLEEICLKSDVHLAEVASVHQILTLVLTEPVRVPPRSHQRMYALVDPPAGQPNRRPVKAHALAGVSPTEPARPEHDDADTAFLLGMSRYTSASAANRLALVGAVVLTTAVLVGAVLMTVWNRGTEPAASAPGSSLVSANPNPQPPTSRKPPEPPVDPIPEAPMPKGKMTEPDVTTPMKPKEKMPDEEIVNRVPPPIANRDEIGKVETPNVLVLARENANAEWVRVDAAEPVSTQDELLCLPGYKADVGLPKSKVTIHMWGNVPELLGSTGPGVRVPFECRLHLHPPMNGFDADFTLLAGRVYLSTRNPDGAKVRVRFAGEVWDVGLKDAKSDVMVEVVTAYVPGSAYARVGGEKPRVSARLAVTKGAAELEAPNRFKKAADVQDPSVITWDSASGQVVGPRPYDRGDVNFTRFLDPFLPPKQAEIVNQSLAAFVGLTTDPKKVRLTISEQLDKPADANPVRQGVYRLAVFAQAAVASGPDGADRVRVLLDVLDSETRGYARSASADALSLWLARDPQNTARLFAMLEEKRVPADEADLVLRLLRGYVPVRKPNPADLDALVNMLTARSLRVRELALWNLMNFVDPSAAVVPGLFTDVAFDKAEYGYDKFLAAWKNRIEEVKKRKEPSEGKEEKKDKKEKTEEE